MSAEKIAALRAEIEYLETVGSLEAALVAAKADGPAPRELKLELREARKAYREARDARSIADAVASPATIEVVASVEEV